MEKRRIAKNINLMIDPDNVFWAISRGGSDPKAGGFQDAVSLYERVNPKISRDFNAFRKNRKLAAVYVNLTDRCNANCSYCYIPHQIRQSGAELDWDKLEFILNSIIRHFKTEGASKPLVIFHAAEPLLKKDLLFLAVRKFSGRILFGVQTNAILLEKKDVDFLIKYRVNVGISLDSYDEMSNNKARSSKGGGNFKCAVRALKWFNGYPRLNVITTINKFNVRQLPEIVSFLHKLRVPCALLNPVRLTQKHSRKVRPKQADMAKYFLLAVKTATRLSLKSGRKIAIGNFENVILAIVAPMARRLMCDISPCGGGRVFLNITADGDMIPCGEFAGLREFSGGNIFRDGSIASAMDSSAFRKIRGRVVEDIKECDVCVLRNICGAPCPAELYAYKGSMNKKSVFCRFYKKIITYAFKLIADEKYSEFIKSEVLKGLEYEYEL
ncbi:MAG: peptide-modifying radical SAM enzyme CbpB [Candidatus Omnitrophica bacterium]|nr:peptide-modifying radical SAM enzyme CbpB [Candidatus Omnitrophota bacterium]